MRRSTRILGLVLALLTVCSLCTLFVACGDDPTPTPGPSEDDTEKLLDITKYSGRTCRIWIRKGFVTPIWVEEAGVSNTSRATRKRIEAIQDKTGIKIEPIESQTIATVYEGSGGDTFVLDAMMKANDPEQTPDILMPGGVSACTLASMGYFIDLDSDKAPYIDLTHPGWQSQANDALSICGTYYTVSGMFSTRGFESVGCMYFNKDLLGTLPAFPTVEGDNETRDKQFASLYELAKEGNNAKGGWTFPKMLSYVSQYYVDDDGKAGKTEGDTFGYTYSINNAYATHLACGIHYVEQDENGIPKVVANTEQVLDVLEWLRANIQQKDFAWGGADAYPGFRGGKVVFANGEVGNLSGHSAVENFNFGVLPMPKFNDAQENYCGFAHAWSTLLAAIPACAKDTEFSSFCLQLITEMGYTPWADGITTLYDAYVTDSLIGRYAPSDYDIEMLQIVLPSLVYDMSDFYYGWRASGQSTLANMMRNAFNNGSADFKSTADSVADAYATNILQTLEKLGLIRHE